MAVKIADITAVLSLDDRSYTRGLSAAQGKATAFGNVVQGILQGAGQQLFRGIVSGLETVVSKMGDAIQASSNLSESVNKAGVLFGDSAQEILAFADTADKAFGQSKQQALDAASTFATFGRAAGLSGESLVKFSTDFVGLASDMASFSNTSPQDAIIAIGAALRGESEPIRRYGVLLDEATLRQKALQLGIVDTIDKALTPQQRVLATQVAIYQQTSAAQGDFARTSTGLANAQRILAAEIENGSAKLGDSFRPALQAITNSLIGIAPQMFQYATNIMDQFANGIAAGIRAILPAIQVIRQLFSYWFAPGSPPRILPDIAKWGAQTMQVYLDSFSAVDVKGAFDTVGRAIETILRSQVSAGKASEGGLVTAIFGTRAAILQAVSEFSRVGAVSESTINKIARSAGAAGPGIASLVRAYFDLQKASTAATRAQDELNRITEQYDTILNPLQGKLDSVRAEQRKLADQQRLIAAQNVLFNFDSTAAEKRAAQLEIEQIALEDQISTVEQQKKAKTDAAQADLDGAKKAENAAQKQLDIAQAAIDQQVETNNLIAEQIRFEERLAQERQAAADKAEAEAKKQQQLAEQLHQAQLQYQLGISNTQQKLSILRGELANTTAGTVEYFNILGEIASLEKQAAEETKRDAEKVSDAQLNYNLSLADTAGKIAIWQGELAKTTVGSAEYFQILTKIHDLTVQYGKELDKLGGADIGAGLTAALGDMPKLEESLSGKNLRTAIEEAFAPVGPANENVKKLAESLGALGGAIERITGLDFSAAFDRITAFFGGQQEKTQIGVKAWNDYGLATFTAAVDAQKNAKETEDKTNAVIDSITAKIDYFRTTVIGLNWKQMWEDYKQYALTANSDFDKDTQAKLDHIQTAIDFFAYITNLTWTKYWADWKTIWDTGFGLVKSSFETTLGGLTTKLTGWFTDAAGYVTLGFTSVTKAFYNGGVAVVGGFWDGLKAKWTEVETWFSGALKGLTDKLPFSEPKDPTSPLRGLKKSGESMVGMIQAGMDAASLTIKPLANNLLAPATATTTNNTSHNMGPITIQIYANGGDVKAIGTAAKDGILEVMRAAGMA